MIFLLFFLLFLLTLSAFFLLKEDLFSPIVLCNGFFCLSSFVFLLNVQKWNYFLSVKTVFIVLFFLVVFNIGYCVGRKITFKNRFSFHSFCISKNFSNLFFIFFCLLDCIIIFRYVSFIYSYASLNNIDTSLGFFSLLSSLRDNLIPNSNTYRTPILLKIGVVFVRAFGFFCVYYWVLNVIQKNYSNCFKYSLGIICYILLILLGTGRGEFIILICSFMFAFYKVLHLYNNTVSDFKFIFYGGIAVLIFLLLFIILGYLRNSSLDWFDWFSVYIGSPILCLDDYLLNSDGSQNGLFGEKSFFGVYNMLRHFGFNIPFYSSHFKFVDFGSDGYHFSSNIYTIIYTFISDFGIWGGAIVMMLSGSLFGAFWSSYKKSNITSLFSIIYGGLFGYASIMMFITERLFSVFLSLSSIALVFTIIIISYLLRGMAGYKNI